MAAKGDFISKNIETDNLIYLSGSTNKYELMDLKIEKCQTKNDDIDWKVCTPSLKRYNTPEDNGVTARIVNTHGRINTGGKSHECGTCHKQFTRAGNLKVHERIHTGVKRYVCGTCHKQFGHSGDLKKHMK